MGFREVDRIQNITNEGIVQAFAKEYLAIQNPHKRKVLKTGTSISKLGREQRLSCLKLTQFVIIKS